MLFGVISLSCEWPRFKTLNLFLRFASNIVTMRRRKYTKIDDCTVHTEGAITAPRAGPVSGVDDLDGHHRRRNRGALGARVPQIFCDKQRSALLIFRKCPPFLKKIVPSKCCAPPSLRCFLRP